MSNLYHAIRNAFFSTKKGIDNRVVSLIITIWRLFLPRSAVISNLTFLCRFGRRRCPPGTQPLNRHKYFYSREAVLMIRIFALFLFLTAATFFAACGSAPANNANVNSNRAVTLDNNNLPPGLSTSPVPITGTPTPGIPTPEEIRKQMGMQPKDGTPPPGSSADTPMMKKNTNKLPKRP